MGLRISGGDRRSLLGVVFLDGAGFLLFFRFIASFTLSGLENSAGFSFLSDTRTDSGSSSDSSEDIMREVSSGFFTVSSSTHKIK